jgi:hypothetical protein
MICRAKESGQARLTCLPACPITRVPLRRDSLGNQVTTARSIVVAEGADRHDVAFWCKTLEAKSPKAPMGSPEPNT